MLKFSTICQMTYIFQVVFYSIISSGIQPSFSVLKFFDQVQPFKDFIFSIESPFSTFSSFAKYSSNIVPVFLSSENSIICLGIQALLVLFSAHIQPSHFSSSFLSLSLNYRQRSSICGMISFCWAWPSCTVLCVRFYIFYPANYKPDNKY